MSKVKILKNPEEVYFKTITLYHLEIDGKELLVNYEQDSNGSEISYIIDDEISHTPPEWLSEIDFGDEYIDYSFEDWFDDVRHELKEGQINDE